MFLLILLASLNHYKYEPLGPYGSIGFLLLLIIYWKSALNSYFNLRHVNLNNSFFILFILILVLSVQSLINTFLLEIDGVSFVGISPFNVFYKQIILYILLFINIYFLCFLFDRKNALSEFIKQSIYFSYIVSFVGIIQVLYLITGFVAFSHIVNFLSIIGFSVDSSYLDLVGRVTSIMTEPSGLGVILPGFILPMYIYKLKFMDFNIFDIINLFILSIVTYFSFSSSAVLGCIFILFSFLFIQESKENFMNKVFFTIFSILPISLVFGFIFLSNQDLFLKVVDFENQSTAHRFTTLYNGFLVFFDNVFFGVGNGNQGFYYFDNIYGSFLHGTSKETSLALSGELGVLNGGAFFPAYISAYGLFGLFGLYFLINRIKNIIFKCQHIKPIYVIWLPVSFYFLFSSLVSVDIHGNNLFLILFFLPLYLSYNKYTSTKWTS
jgi:hypothetical protein